MKTYYNIYMNDDFWIAFGDRKNAVDYMNEYKKSNQCDKAELVITGGRKSNVSR